MVQEILLTEGLAKVAYLYEDYDYTEKLQTLEKTAKDKKIGIWSNDNVSLNMDATEEDISKEENKNQSIIDLILNFIKELLTSLINELFK